MKHLRVSRQRRGMGGAACNVFRTFAKNELTSIIKNIECKNCKQTVRYQQLKKARR